MNRVELFRDLTTRLSHSDIKHLQIIPWASPVPFFGNLDTAKVATVGLNPSNREFADAKGSELVGQERRFPTLSSLGLSDWQNISDSQLRQIDQACTYYFNGNPYDAWFRVLDKLMVGLNHSYYGLLAEACHLDLCPFATHIKWGELSTKLKARLLEKSGDFFNELIAMSELRVLILNGQAVIRTFESVIESKLTHMKIDEWTLPRSNGQGVEGISYYGKISNIRHKKLRREIVVLGYSHNIQSSFGVTTQVRDSIGSWLVSMASPAITLGTTSQPT